MKLYQKSDLRYSRVFFDKRPPAYAFILIFSTALMLFSGLFVAAHLPKNYIVKARGSAVITGTEFLSAVAPGKIVTMHKAEGEMVTVGEVILSLSSGQEGLQAESLNKQLDKLKAKEAIFQKYEQSLNEKINYMTNTGEEQEYYGKVEYYLSQLKSESYSNGSQYDKLQDEYAKLNKLWGEKNQLELDLQTQQNELVQLQTLTVLEPEPIAEIEQPAEQESEVSTTVQEEQNKTRQTELTSKIETTKSSLTAKVTEIEGQQSSVK
ncbi:MULTISPECIES: hypothetical protein [unclassified Streptococcus]|uniref:hypothetical protein n=1 Tax=unclassified Streptococcus TaxID=2608887 RepID=UPI00359F0F1E